MSRKTALIIGASETFGYFTAKDLLQNGFRVTINARNKEKLSKIKNELESKGEIDYIAGDVSAESTIKSIRDHYNDSGIDALIMGLGGYASDSIRDPTNINAMFEDNVILPFNTLSKLLDLMANPSSVVFMSSVYSSLMVSENSFSYSGSKAALNRMVASAAKSLLKNRIRINAVITTSMEEKPHSETDVHFNPGKQSIDPDLVAMAVVFLAGERSMGITGSVITVDQGFSLR
ncbi:SDR family NAD(P)-dependent oxidoreductase [Thermoplasma sp.]|uniref:SDR family NAD(P)-dependent oxidoreductase n=1 Tax=Thermoplasma sp. TaxID=1973142 RepID=UPI00127D7D5D|nr:SDR family oxidoreductase [Thermoplasma sp.]KAA8923155.1 MAG: SDR family oxidoreductase [Thermoplasma sp.]